MSDDYKALNLTESALRCLLGEPKAYAICPVCNGTKEVPLTDQERSYSWNKGKDKKPCCNCGGQYQSMTAYGVVRRREDGTPCEHSYTNVYNNPRGYHKYRCIHCGDSYEIDSSG